MCRWQKFLFKWADFYLAFVFKQLGLKILVDIDVILSISHTGILDQCQCLEERNRATYYTLQCILLNHPSKGLAHCAMPLLHLRETY